MKQVQFIAEISSNHGNDPDRCLAFVDTAAAIGCDAVKFQLFRIDKLFAPEILEKSPEHRARRQWELDPALIPLIAERCRQKNIAFSCTPFDLEAVEILRPHVAFYKISSYELPWDGLLAAVAATGKPVILSTGMANMSEIGHAVTVLRRHGCAAPTLLHCHSAYPTRPEDCNLAAIATMRQLFSCDVGWSDHSVNEGVIYRAIFRWQAAAIEFHLDLEGRGAEFAAGHCWLPDDIGRVIAGVRDGFIADGDGRKAATATEEAERLWRADPADGLRPFRRIRKDWTPGT